MDATFGKAWEQYPVQPGDVWQADDHLFACGDCVSLFNADKLPPSEWHVDAVHTDPPWNQAVYSIFHTHAKQQADRNFNEFIAGLFDVWRALCPDGPLYFEMGVKQAPAIAERIEQAGGVMQGMVETVYSTAMRPARMWCGNFSGQPMAVPPHGMGGNSLNDWIGARIGRPGARVLDTCCGIGTYPFAAMQHGAAGRGVELIPRKLANALVSLEKMGLQPTRREVLHGA